MPTRSYLPKYMYVDTYKVTSAGHRRQERWCFPKQILEIIAVDVAAIIVNITNLQSQPFDIIVSVKSF